MATDSQNTLNNAFATLGAALARAEAAIDVAAYERAQANAKREEAAAEIKASWESHAAELEAALADVTAENTFLKEDNLRLSNQLQQLQKDYLSLQQAAGNALDRLDVSVKQLDLLLEH